MEPSEPNERQLLSDILEQLRQLNENFKNLANKIKRNDEENDSDEYPISYVHDLDNEERKSMKDIIVIASKYRHIESPFDFSRKLEK